VIATLFYHPILLSFDSELWLLLPLCFAVGLVYKAIRINDLRRLPREMLFLMAYMVVGLTVLCAALWLIQEYWP
jgi:4-hydroxybenzoate polyprenyltransferase